MSYGNETKGMNSARRLNNEVMSLISTRSPSSKTTPRNDFFSSKENPETLRLRKEISSLKKNLLEANKELSLLRKNHENEISSLRNILESMKQEVEILKAEKNENLALQSYGIDEYSALAQEVISLRTEVDRITYSYNKDKRKLHKSLGSSFN